MSGSAGKRHRYPEDAIDWTDVCFERVSMGPVFELPFR